MSSNPVSEAQLAANRANAKLSRGPATAEGLAISSRNHTIHGLTADPAGTLQLLPCESQEAYEAHLAGFQAEFNPSTATEHDIVTRMASHSWLRNRAVRLQNQLIINCGGFQLGPEERKNFELFSRYYSMHGRGFGKALSEIMRLRNFQSKQAKDAAIVERRNLDIQIRFESQKRAAELHAAKLETGRLKQEAQRVRMLAASQEANSANLGAASSTPRPSCACSSEAIKQRNNRAPKPESAAAHVEVAQTQAS